MFGIMFFPFAILIPFLVISLTFRLVRMISQRQLHEHRKDSPLTGILPSRSRLKSNASDEEFEVYVYRLASKSGGILSSARIVVDSGLPMKEVDSRMASMVDNVHVCMDVKDSGLIEYRFPELTED
ncbi:hypothetical protein [Salinispira pacifica]|uniref:Uncharacterized protein n=1 Tax=Salinispira pacifica TaxID=1307761 RepID=V5WH02_9SPIO|nr:hypothetical protein [Salinispira pacifica]AHC15097.1 hypothetical protein L21SP2_1718 [Salinispira pacifica]